MTTERFWDLIDNNSGPDACWPYMGARTACGYGSVKFDGKCFPAHRLAFQLHYKKDPREMFVCHHCDNPPCCNPKHLFLGTPQDNCDDKMSKGRHRVHRGEQHYRSKITDDQACEILTMLRNGSISQRKAASQYGLSRWAVCDLFAGRSWKHLHN